MKIPFDRGNEKIFIEEKKQSRIVVLSVRSKNFKQSIAGFYTCEVSNDFETLTSTGFVRIKNPGIEYFFSLKYPYF